MFNFNRNTVVTLSNFAAVALTAVLAVGAVGAVALEAQEVRNRADAMVILHDAHGVLRADGHTLEVEGHGLWFVGDDLKWEWALRRAGRLTVLAK